MRKKIVFASNIKSKNADTIFLNQSHCWLKSVEWILSSAESEKYYMPYQVLPALFSLYHGVELFLKGVCYKCSGKRKNTHNIKNLLKEYRDYTTSNSELDIKVDIRRLIEFENKCIPNKKNKPPWGSQYRYILNADGKPSFLGFSFAPAEIVHWSRDCRRDFARIRRILYDVKGYDPFWEEGTFAEEYQDTPFWFFCICFGRQEKTHECSKGIHLVCNERERHWLVFEGEAINEDNAFSISVGQIPKPNLRIKCSWKNLKACLSKIDD